MGQKNLGHDGQISVVLRPPLPMPDCSADAIVAMAAAGADLDSRDIVDKAAVANANSSTDLRRFQITEFMAPERGRKFSLSKVLDSGRELLIARGDFDAVTALCKLDAGKMRNARQLASRAASDGYRPWAIATASDSGGPWSFLGVIPVRAQRAPRTSERTEYLFVPIWSFLLRFLHWSWAILITLLILTGVEIQTMWLSAGTTWFKTGFFFGYVRLTHLICGWLLAAAIVARIASAFLTSNPHESWKALIPIKNRRDLAGLWAELKNYVLLRNDEGKKYLAHDPLAQLSFTGVYLAMIGAIVSGFSLYGLYEPQNWFFSIFEWIPRFFGANQVRLFHVVMMWGIILFVPIHIYLVIRADGYAREGSLSAMLSGGRWVRKGARFEDEQGRNAVEEGRSQIA